MKNVFFILTIILVIGSCAPTTYITGSWKSARTNGKNYKTIFVAAVTANTIAKSTLENNMAAALNKYNINTVKSINEFPPDYYKDSISKNVLIDKVHKKGNDAILTITILKKTTESHYVAGNYVYAPMTRFGYYGNFGGYYTYWYPSVYNPGYYTSDDVYFLETNLYDSVTEELVWSAQSETYIYDGLASFSRDFASTIVSRMKTDGVLK